MVSNFSRSKIILGYSLFVAMQIWFPKVMTHFSDVDKYTVHNQRSHSRRNFIFQRALNNEAFGDDVGIAVPETFKPDPKLEELPSMVVDYANMIRNNIILMDNSVETKTKKRGDINMGRHTTIVPDSQCTCENGKRPLFLGNEYYPQHIEISNCSSRLCAGSKRCQDTFTSIPVLRKAAHSDQFSLSLMNGETDWNDQKKNIEESRWVVERKSIPTGCICTSKYIDLNHK